MDKWFKKAHPYKSKSNKICFQQFLISLIYLKHNAPQFQNEFFNVGAC